MIDYATEYCLAATLTPTARGVDALACLHTAVANAQRILQLEDLRADRGELDLFEAIAACRYSSAGPAHDQRAVGGYEPVVAVVLVAAGSDLAWIVPVG